MPAAGAGKTAKLADVAKAAGVSPGTVSNVFNRPEVVREEVQERVREAAARLGYRGGDPKGRMLRAGKVNAIGVATVEPLPHFFTDPYARGVMTGITEAAQENNAGISLVSAANREDFAWNVGNALVDGFILFCLERAPELIRSARERNLPFVALSLGEAYEGIPAIGVDDVAGARMAAEHLTGLGHRRFAVLAIRPGEMAAGPVAPQMLDASSTARERLQGYFDVLREAGIDTATVPIHATHEDAATVGAALAAVFALPEPPTAILAQSDVIALLALDWLRERGISVPEKVSVIGFDGVPEAAVSEPPLTTIVQPMEEIGRRAVRAILDYDGTPTRQILDVALVVRGTTAPPPEA